MLIDALAAGLTEDCPYGDITTDLLGLDGAGRFAFIARAAAVVSGTPRLAAFLAAQGLAVTAAQPPGARIDRGDTVLAAAGDLKTLFKLWRISQTYLTVLGAIATQTASIVRAAREENAAVDIVVACRKAHLGMRGDEIQAVLDGGALYHRNSLSDTILITQNHLRVLGSLPDKLVSFHHKLEFEPSSPEEAYRYADRVDVMLLDHFEPDALGAVACKLRALNPRLLVGVAGGITLANVKSYAPHVDVIVLSSVLYAPPLDITCKITRE